MLVKRNTRGQSDWLAIDCVHVEVREQVAVLEHQEQPHRLVTQEVHLNT